MDPVLRPVSADELASFVRTDFDAFGERHPVAPPQLATTELDRTVAAFEGDRIVATSRNYSLELTLPGGAIVPAAGLSAVAVLPTHRRRGLLRSMMVRLIDDAVGRSESLAMLTASEGAIYGRFGFGVSTRVAAVEIDRRDVEFASGAPMGALRLVGLDEARKLEPEVFERARAVRPGAVSRPEAWWPDEQFASVLGTRFDVVHETPAGPDGFLTYGVKPKWATDGPEFELTVRDLVGVTAEATNALWRFACEVDLVRTVTCSHAPLDLALPWMLESARAVRVRGVHDFLWTRILDACRALGARAYATDGALVVEVFDPSRPHGDAAGTFLVDGGPDGATVVRTGRSADLGLGVADLSAAWLGGVRFSTLARAGRVEERTSGALARADAMFASEPLPDAMTWF